MRRTVGFILLLLMLSGGIMAQGAPDSCPTLVEFALATVGDNCTELGRNQVCYGHDLLTVEPFDGAMVNGFEDSGDVTAVERIRVLETAAMDIDRGIWGVAVMALQANIPDTLPGQNVIFVIYGDAQLTAEPDIAVQGYSAPMQAFRLSTGIGEPACVDAPRDGVLVQSPAQTTVNFLVNGVEIEVGSTILLDVREDDALWVSTLEGRATVTAEGQSQAVLPGEKVSIKPGESPSAHEPFANPDLQGVPVSLLPERVHVPFVVDPRAGTEGWIEAPITVEADRTYTINASGTVNIYAGCDPQTLVELGLTCADMIFGPEGSTTMEPATAEQPIPGAYVGALIGRVGLYGEPFVIGNATTFTADQTATLYLRINDVAYPEDNVGAFIAVLEGAD